MQSNFQAHLHSNWPLIRTPLSAQHLLRDPSVQLQIVNNNDEVEPAFQVVHEDAEVELSFRQPMKGGRIVSDGKGKRKKIRELLAVIKELQQSFNQTHDLYLQRYYRKEITEAFLQVDHLRKYGYQRYTTKEPVGSVYKEPDQDGEDKYKIKHVREFEAGQRNNRESDCWKDAGYKHTEKKRGAIYEHEDVFKSDGTTPCEYSAESRHKCMSRRFAAPKQYAAHMKKPRHSYKDMTIAVYEDTEAYCPKQEAEASKNPRIDLERKMWAEIAEFEAEELMRLHKLFEGGMFCDSARPFVPEEEFDSDLDEIDWLEAQFDKIAA